MRDFHRFGVVLVFVIWCVLWLPNLGVLPAWDWDEGYNLNYGWNLSMGRVLWFTIKYAFIPHLPLYLLLVGFLVKAFGNSILVIRVLSVVLNLALILVIYLVGGVVKDRRTGFFASLLFVVYPAAVYWGRMGFANHLMSLLVLSSMYCFLRFVRDGGRWWVPSCLLAGLSAVTEPQGLVVAAVLLGYFVVAGRGSAAFAFLFGFFAVFSAVMLSANTYFLGDILFQIERFHLTGPKMLLALPVLVLVFWKRRVIVGFVSYLFSRECGVIFGSGEVFRLYYVPAALLGAHFLASITLFPPLRVGALFVGGDYYWIGILGLLFLEGCFLNSVVLLYFLPSFLSVIAFGRADHMLIPLYPFFALGLAVLLQLLYSYLNPRVGVFVAVLVLSYPFVLAFVGNFSAYVVGGVLEPEPVADLASVASYVNSHSGAGDYVITTSNLARFFRNASVISQAVVYEGYPIDYYHAKDLKERYVFNCSFRNAAYAVVPNGTVEWLRLYAPGPADEIGGWPVVNRSGEYLVYRNTLIG